MQGDDSSDVDPANDGDDEAEARAPGDDLQDSDEEDDDDLKKGGRRPSNVLDTTAATADMTMDETFDASQPQVAGQQSQQSSATPVTSFRDLHRLRRNRIRLHYSSGSYHASPSAWTAYSLSRQLRFGDVPDLLWLACVGVTDAYLCGRLDLAGYGALTVDLKRHVGRLFPNDLVDRAGRAVFAEELLESSNNPEGGDNNQTSWTQIGLSENGRILSQSEYKFMLLRHTSLWDSLLHSNFVASKLQVWKGTGRQRLMELLAKMGFPLESCRQPWAFVGTNMKRRIRERIEDCTEVSVEEERSKIRICDEEILGCFCLMSISHFFISVIFIVPTNICSILSRNTVSVTFHTRASSESLATGRSYRRATCHMR